MLVAALFVKLASREATRLVMKPAAAHSTASVTGQDFLPITVLAAR